MLTLSEIREQVKRALAEDIGAGDLTAQLLPNKWVQAQVITREPAVLCGAMWVTETFRQLDGSVHVTWHAQDGQAVLANQCLFSVAGPAPALLTGERTALNFLQTLSGTATLTHEYVKRIRHTRCRLLDTRKTIPGLRLAQKYAVRCGGGFNHRIGLFDAFLIKENHIAACGSISEAVKRARRAAHGQLLEVEVETLAQLEEAISARVDRVMLDNFSLAQMREGVTLARGRVPLEVSGNVNLHTIAAVAETGVDFISVGALTKNVGAIDLSMRLLRA